MSRFYYSISAGAPSEPVGRWRRLFLPLSIEAAIALETIGSGATIGSEARSLPPILREGIRAERWFFYGAGRVNESDWQMHVQTNLVTRLSRVRGCRLPEAAETEIWRGHLVGGVPSYWGIWTDHYLHELSAPSYYLALAFSNNTEERAFGFDRLRQYPDFMQGWFDALEKGAPSAGINGKPYVSTLADWTPHDLAPLLACADRRIRQRVRLLIGLAANRERSEPANPKRKGAKQ